MPTRPVRFQLRLGSQRLGERLVAEADFQCDRTHLRPMRERLEERVAELLVRDGEVLWPYASPEEDGS